MRANDFCVVIEIPRDSRIKYELNPETNSLEVDRFLHTSHAYPFNYGFILGTLGGDGDPVDAVVLCDYSLFPLCRIQCRAIGVVFTEDEKGRDEKIIMIPIAKIDPFHEHVQDLGDVSQHTVDNIKHFFEHYKSREQGKWSKVTGVGNSSQALEVITKSMIV